MDCTLVETSSPEPTLAPDLSELDEPTSNRKSRKRLTAAEIGRILVLRDEGNSPAEISRKLGRHHTTIKTCLDSLVDTREAAKAMLHAAAAGMASRVAEQASPVVCVDVLERIDVLKPKQSAGASQGVQVIVGIAGLPGLPGASPESGQLKPLDAPVMVHVPCKSLETKD